MVTAYFLDSSALLKRYIPETGTNWIQSLTVNRHPLRAYDAVQLASALCILPEISQLDTATFTFLTADNRLIAVAQAENLKSDNPNNHP